jgi:thiamine-monophosphate kinase
MREWDLLRHVFRASAALAENPAVTIPPGDDMGAIRIGGVEVLITVDQLADGVHVDLTTTPIAKVGRKAITRNLSDVAAMAASPVAAVVAASLPKAMGERRATSLFDAMRQAAAAFDCPLIGGDVSMWDSPLLLSVTVLAEPAGVAPVLRRGAKAGDAIYVTGRLGGSIEEIDGCTHHLDFEPRVALARRLAGDPATRPHAMIDLSDGLASDLRHICDASDVRAVVELAKLPVSPAAERAAARSGREAWMHAVLDGEDYELLFAAPHDAIPREIDGVAVTPIGRFERTDRPGVVFATPDGGELELRGGWEHHA